MRPTRRSPRRVSLTRRLITVAVLALLVAAAPLLRPFADLADASGDDYPTNLRNAPQDSMADPWLFYNRECTSFVAWRVNHVSDVPFHNYYGGVHWGDASNWSKAAKAVGVPVDNNPVVGAVAWWAAGSAGSSRGHVAWVQSNNGSSITIEEYNYVHRGGYDTRVIAVGSSMWPSGFLHIKDLALRAIAHPVVSGTPKVGLKLTTSVGSWSPGGATYHFSWLANGTPIAGATRRTFTPTADQVGKKIRSVVVATKSGMRTARSTSSPTAPVDRGTFANTAAATISGTPQVGLQLSATTGAWSPAATYTYQWSANRVAIPGATASTFTPTATELGKVVRVRVTASAPGYDAAHSTSEPTVDVASGQFSRTTAPTITGTPQVDSPLTASPGTWTPTGTAAYQWLADGVPVTGATRATYTPSPADLRKQISVQVTLTQTGYADAVAASAATDPVAPGTFLNTREPAVSGKPQVGVPLTADPGAWSPAATLTYQWFAGGDPIEGATARRFTPTAAELGRTITVQVTANRPGYLTAVVPSVATEAVAPGHIDSHQRPTITGTPRVGRTLHASSGSWSVTPGTIAYQWYADGARLDGAIDPTYDPTADDAGKHLTVRVTITSPGYDDATSESAPTSWVSLGVVGFATPPHVNGRAVLGQVLTTRLGAANPSTATPSYQWYRDHDTRIRGAHDATYTLRPADVGHRVHVLVTLHAEHWTNHHTRSQATRIVRSIPVLRIHDALRHGRVELRLAVRAPGIAAPTGRMQVTDHGHLVGHAPVVDGHVTKLLRRLNRGTHRLVLHYAGPHQTNAHTLVIVQVP